MRLLYKNGIHKLAPRALMLATAIALSGCQHAPVAQSESLPPEFQGTWQSDGYGYLIEVQNETLMAYHLTLDVCVYDQSIAEAFEAYARNQVTGGQLTVNSDATALYFSEPFEDYQIQLNKVNGLPARCQTPPQNNPVDTFNTFASYMATHYAFFELYDVNWPEVVAQNRAKITKDLSDEALFDILSNMLEPLKDAHLSLQGNVNGKSITYRPERSLVGDATAEIAKQLNTSKSKIDQKLFEQYWLDDIEVDILNGRGEMIANELIQYGITSADIGYIALANTYNYSNEGLYSSAKDQAALSDALDNAITLFNQRQVKAVIIDLSINFGGHSFPATDIAARFTDQTLLAFSKRAHNANDVEPFPVIVSPSTQPSYYGPVYLLAANVTVSGGEEIVLALRALPNVTFIGERTRGALSDILDKPLPNGWVVALSNEIYSDHQGIEWEGDGIQPDIEAVVFDRDNPFEGHLEAVDNLIERIDQLH